MKASGRRTRAEVRRAKRVIKSRFGSKLDATVQTVFPFLFHRPLSPNALTVLGVFVSVAAAVALGMGALVLGGILLLAGGFFDLVDGVVARHFERQTPFGAFLDSTMDRLVDMVLLLGVIVYLAGEGDRGGVILAGVAGIGGAMTSYIKARAETIIPVLDSGFFERAERILILALGVLSGWLIACLWILALGSVYTASARFVAARRAIEGKPGSADFTIEPSRPSGEQE